MITRLPNGEELVHDILDPDLEAALKQWAYEEAWFDIERSGGMDSYDECPCCSWDYRASDDFEEDAYAHWAIRKEEAEKTARRERAERSRDQARNWFWTLLNERTGWLPSIGTEELCVQLATAKRHGL